jgi:hypothetical protein
MLREQLRYNGADGMSDPAAAGLHLGRGECVLPRFFKESDDLFALYAGESFEELLESNRQPPNDRTNSLLERGSQ